MDKTVVHYSKEMAQQELRRSCSAKNWKISSVMEKKLEAGAVI
jgi:hypothetical protein